MQTKTKITLLLFLILGIFSISAVRTLALNVTSSITVLPSEIMHLMVQWAIPEKMTGTPGTNDNTSFYLTLRDPNNHSVMWTQPNLLETDVEGRYLTDIPVEGLTFGTYDIGFKGSVYLTKVLMGIPLSSDVFTANFTNNTVSNVKGPDRLVAGDVDGDGLTPATSGDDVINSSDLSILIHELDGDTDTDEGSRADFNRDGEINSVELSLLLANLDKEGEK